MIDFLKENSSVIFLSTIGGMAGLYYSQNYYPKYAVLRVDLASLVYSKVSKSLDAVKPFIPAKIVEKLTPEYLEECSDVDLFTSNIPGSFQQLLHRISQRFGFSKSAITKITQILEQNKVSITFSISGFILVFCILKKFLQKPRSTGMARREPRNLDPLTLLLNYLKDLVSSTSRVVFHNEGAALLLCITLFLTVLHLNPDLRRGSSRSTMCVNLN